MSAQNKILIIEDEAAISQGLQDYFSHHGYAPTAALNGISGLDLALTGEFDLILLDVMLPGMDGFEICNRIRATNRTLPIIMLTAKTAEADIVRGLTLGADDYVAKPFSIEALRARVEAVLRRTNAEPEPHATFQVGDVLLDATTLEGSRGEEKMAFSRREMDILIYLHQHKDRPVSRTELLKEVWGYENPEMMETRTVDIHMTKLRRKLKDDAATPKHLVTIRGEGYRLLP